MLNPTPVPSQPTARQLLSTLVRRLQPQGWTLHKTGSNGQWMLTHATGKRKIRVWPASGKWSVMNTCLTGGGLHIPAGMPTGTGADSLFEQIAKWGLV